MTESNDNSAAQEEVAADKPEKAEKAEKKKQRSPMAPVQLFLLNCLIIVTVVWLMFDFVLGPAQAPNSDMSPNIKANDLLLYYRLSRDFQAQDVVVVSKNKTTYIGRIVAVPGDTVDISDAEALVINGNSMIEPNVYTITPKYEGFVEYPVKLGEGEYFILCDNRSGSEDSRYYGSVAKSEIKGKVITAVRRNDL
ncbi:signal peptidase I [Ruminococcus sp.]|uniref:signal peptidase I n=1 Tax=Ruminococcus sp. TaxID=41978 RepID=UPI0025CB94DB|nr:signal peptidase I [Ruminococcus sp.]MBQ6250465.1 signal peptidase I [Ruminococcus sp.]